MKTIFRRLLIYAAVLLLVLLIGTIGFSLIEGYSILDSFYFTFVTVATVGYGDIHAVTTAGKILAMVIIILGVGTFTGAIVNAIGLLAEKRQQEGRKERQNTLIELFFSEIGNQLLAQFAAADPGIRDIRIELKVNANRTDMDFENLGKILAKHKYTLDRHTIDLEKTRDLLRDKHDLIMQLLENPNLSEHESFTDLLKATFHLREELLARPTLSKLQESDAAHLTVDTVRVYGLLTKKWITYMSELKNRYPYLYSFSVRTNPFSEDRSPTVSG
jgi:voltage-gated potassium channel